MAEALVVTEIRRYIFGLWRRTRTRLLRCLFDRATLNNLVEFAPVKPDTTALRAIIYFDALAITHYQRYFANRAGHSDS